jgi:hypothetical protein
MMAWRFLALLVTALSLGPSFAHVLEAYPRLATWSPELWREATVFGGQFQMFAVVGAPLDLGAIFVTIGLTYVTRRARPAFWFALCSAFLFAGSLLTWFGVVSPANGVLATWQPGPIPADFNEVRWQWELGHMAVASLKLVGFCAVALAVLQPGQIAGEGGGASECADPAIGNTKGAQRYLSKRPQLPPRGGD